MRAVEDILEEEGVILYPTETIYGLGCDPFSKKAVKRIQAIKGRDANKPFLILCSDFEEVLDFFELSPEEEELLEEAWPAPLTVLLTPTTKALKHLVGPSGKIGVRVPEHDWLDELWGKWPGMLVSTSANRGGVPYLHEEGFLKKEFMSEVDGIFLASCEGGEPSTLAEFDGEQWNILRDGAFPLATFLES